MSEFSTLWEAHKAVFHGECIAEGSRLKKDRNSFLQTLTTALAKAERQLLCSPTVLKLCKVTTLREQIKSTQLEKAVKSLLWSKQKFYEFSNKPHKILVNKLRPRPFNSFPDFLLQTDGSRT